MLEGATRSKEILEEIARRPIQFGIDRLEKTSHQL
jgi:hypothetical protein